jgi:hypothetical protein
MQKKRIGPVRGCLSAIVVVIVLFVIIGVVAGGSSSKKGSNSNTSTASGTAVRNTKPGNSERAAARAWITKMHHDWNDVQVSVQAVQAGLQILTKDGATPSAMVQFSQLAQQSHDSIDGIRDDFATTDTSGKLGNAELELFTAANGLKNSMGQMVVVADSNASTGSMAKFEEEYGPARSEWNAGVREIWKLAGKKHPPTV